MPNWCYCSVDVMESNNCDNKGEELSRFVSDLKKNGEYAMNNIFPTPELEGNGWYDWNHEHWGTKWDFEQPYSPSDESIGATASQETFYISYDVPWGPNLNFWINVTRIYKLRIEGIYHEGGMAFAGKFVYENGKTIRFEEVDSNDTWEYYKFLKDNDLEDQMYITYETWDPDFTLEMRRKMCNEDGFKFYLCDMDEDVIEEFKDNDTFDISTFDKMTFRLSKKKKKKRICRLSMKKNNKAV